MQATILVIDDENAIRKLLDITLAAQDFRVVQAENARQGQNLAASHRPDLILLDLGLPDEDGQTALKKLREWFVGPILILSARHEESEIIRALDAGANDYLTKPFRAGELVARIRSALRQSRPESQEPTRLFGNIEMDFAARSVRKSGEAVKLTSTEWALLALFVRNEGRALTHAFILREIWGPGYVERTEYPRVFVGQLRKKIEDDWHRPSLILTESGIGYRFSSD